MTIGESPSLYWRVREEVAERELFDRGGRDFVRGGCRIDRI
jgi:hypothetical protein